MRDTVDIWLSTNPIPGGLRLDKNKRIAQAYATNHLAQVHSEFFQRSPDPSLASKAPYGFVAWVLETNNAKVKRERRGTTGSMEPLGSQASSHVSNSESVGQISTLPNNPQPREQIGLLPQAFNWLRVAAVTSESQLGSTVRRVSLDEILIEPPSGDILPAKVAVRYVSYDFLISWIKRQGLLTATRLALIAREDPSFADTTRRQLIESDSLLREAIRYMLEVKGRPLDFWVADGKGHSSPFLVQRYQC